MQCVKSYVEPDIEYPYPENNFWFAENKLLDNRTIVNVHIPGLIHKNMYTTKIMMSCVVTVDYESVVEMEVNIHDMVIGADGIIEVELFNQGFSDIVGEMMVLIYDGISYRNYTKTITITSESSLIEIFAFVPDREGTYEVKVLFNSDDITIGPRVSYFEAGEMEFELDKKFIPSSVRIFRNKIFPKINIPEIKIKNIGNVKIEKINIVEELPENFHIPSMRFLRHVPVFVFLVDDTETHRFRKMKILSRKYYDVEISDDGFTLNINKELGQGETLLVKYIMMSSKADNTGEISVVTSAELFSNGASVTESITKSLIIK